jgi:beta-lactamase regulating signal transducer with metallopeptidase domain
MLTPVERQSIIAHELAHLRRGDHRVRWLQLAATAIYWWHPIAWLASRRVSRAAELCCDALVLWRFPERSREYGDAVFKAMELFSTSAPAPSALALGFGQGRFLKRRFKMIVHNRFSYPVARPVWMVILLFSACALPLSLHQSWADEATDASGTQTNKAAAAASTDKPTNTDVQKRLDRVEAMLAELVEQSKKAPRNSSGSGNADKRRQAGPSNLSAGLEPDISTASDSDVPSDLDDSDVEPSIDKFMRDFESRYQLRETSFNRLIAAQRQVKSVDAAYENGTVTLDLLLDAQRKLVDADIAYARASLELNDPNMSATSHRTLQLLTLKALKKGRQSALATWKKVHAPRNRFQRRRGGEGSPSARRVLFLSTADSNDLRGVGQAGSQDALRIRLNITHCVEYA